MEHETAASIQTRDRFKTLIQSAKQFTGPEIYLIVVLLIFGVGAVFLLPVSAGYDEETHLLRVWEMSSLTFLPNEKLSEGMPFPAVYWEMSYRRPFIVRAFPADFLDEYKGLSVDAHDYIYGSVETRSVYSPPLLLPQAMVMRFFGRSERWSALTTFYACRLVGLLSFLFLAWLAVRVVPFGKWTLAILASSPVIILQSSTIGADAISNGIAFLFIGGTLALAYQKDLGWKEWTAFAFLFLILFWGKLNIVPLAVLPFLLLKPSNFKMRFGYVSLLLMAVLLLLLEVAGWNLVAYSRLHTTLEGADPVGQIKFMLGAPFEFSAILMSNIWQKAFSYLLDWIAIYGFAYWPVPVITYYLYMASVLVSLPLNNPNEVAGRKARLVLIAVFVITYLATILSLYVTYTPVGSSQVEGVQGRYFVTVMPLLFLALTGLPFLRQVRIPVFLPILLGAASLIAYVSGMYLSYHVPCGSQFYQGGLCYQPNYKNWAPDALYSPPVTSQLTISQEIVPECNGVTELRVWIDATGADPNQTTTFVLRDVHQSRDIGNISVQNSKLPMGNWYALTFPVDWQSNGKFYLLTISAGQNAPGPQIAYSLRQEYPAGKLYENGQVVNKDIIFQTGCIAGWETLQSGR